MEAILDIIPVTKDDLDGVTSTIKSTAKLRSTPGVRHIIVDSSDAESRTAHKQGFLKFHCYCNANAIFN